MSNNHQHILTQNKSEKGVDMPENKPVLKVLDLFSGIRPAVSVWDWNALV